MIHDPMGRNHLKRKSIIAINLISGEQLEFSSVSKAEKALGANL
jgi:hypothetical protein